MMEYLVPIGILVIFIGFILILIGAIFASSKGKTDFAVVGLIGPLPFGIASREDLLKFGIIITLILFAIFILISRSL
ncbi:MAG: DUF131 domain-containing protein [Candidatus Aenigmatarchaeota archaeon]